MFIIKLDMKMKKEGKYIFSTVKNAYTITVHNE